MPAHRGRLGGCHAAGRRHRAITREQALAARADGIRTCIHRRPDAELGVLGQPGAAGPSRLVRAEFDGSAPPWFPGGTGRRVCRG
ncbi:DUF6233 domain-containing protein [Streptomyces sp. NRRL B-24720]|uniref:DUF6233 domain-containing protein n=1 Tax=Streptomyces sp. NRRL B-24720 TaxID=1476876 RepID=UPI00099C773C